ncbi:glyoxylase-like metal-dependent hydrolase (beta-lactamase superfamily II) [Marinobacter nauticus]|uniref:Glyoxylase-like metal-dependent hydrolase (Beta-lactamase superfamily II) n=1 Tax=Marinobacter nauticus TaxID=2743 RepID=A0A368X9K9_MARNT|nr:MBL fold metallo-hydrolase [Marinobacter nauticus]RCW64643.1 glyoxylase-like metal-dependent hydrolase (beta-lactamase superfamily II) [Marinobacter nauticus]
MSLKYKIVPVTPFEQNCTLLWCTETHKAAVVDPGGDLDRILAAAEDEGVILEKILLTHAHIDHAGGTAELAKSAGLPIEGPHKDDNFWIQGLAMQAQMFGFPAPEVFTPNRWLEDGDTVTVGNETLEVLHTPGHTPGHVVFFHRGSKLAQVGDVLFNGSIGRTDFPKGDYNTLIHSIREKLFPLGDDVSFICGHGPMSTLGQERATNPFVSDHRG